MANFTLLIFIILLICFAVTGYKRGLQEELNRFIVFMISIFTISLVLMFVSSYKNGETRNVIYTIVIFLLLAMVYSILSKIMKSLGLIVKLPLIGFANRLLGLCMGICFSVLILWILVFFAEKGFLGFASEQISRDIASSKLLQFVTKYNLFVR